MSDEVLVHTAEGAPTMPPEDITMTTLNAASIKVTWASPPLVSANGVIKGKKNSNSNIFLLLQKIDEVALGMLCKLILNF